MKPQILWLALILVATGCKKKQQEVHPEMKLLTSAVYASGTLVPEQEYKAVSGVDGYLQDVLVKEGDVVKNGQLLFTLSNEVRNAQEYGASAMVQKTIPTVADNAPALQQLQGQMDVARIRKTQDSLNYVRYKALYDQDAISKSNYEKFYLQYQSSEKDYRNLYRQYEQLRLSNALQLQQAKNQLAVATAQSDIGNIKSFVDGTVFEVYKKKGDLITPNQPIALIGAGQMYAKLLVDEDDLGKVQEGQKVLITLDAFPDKVFKAHVAKKYPLLNKVEQSFRVDAVLDEPIPGALYGLNLEANIVIAEKKQVLAIPKSALIKGDSVIIKKEGKEMKVKLRKGVEDEQWVEVPGMDSNATIIIRP